MLFLLKSRGCLNIIDVSHFAFILSVERGSIWIKSHGNQCVSGNIGKVEL